MPRLENRVAIITGAASGIGEGTVRNFAAEGARVLIADIDDARGGTLAEELGPTTPTSVPMSRAKTRWRAPCRALWSAGGGSM